MVPSPRHGLSYDVRDALESIVLQIEGPEEPRDTKVVSDAHGMVHLFEAVKDTMPHVGTQRFVRMSHRQ